MSATFRLLAPLMPREMLGLEAACEREVEAYLEAHPDCEDGWGELSAGGSIPTRPEVVAEYRRYHPLAGRGGPRAPGRMPLVAAGR